MHEDAIIEDACKLEMTTIETTRSWVQSLLSAMAYVYDAWGHFVFSNITNIKHGEYHKYHAYHEYHARILQPWTQMLVGFLGLRCYMARNNFFRGVISYNLNGKLLQVNMDKGENAFLVHR